MQNVIDNLIKIGSTLPKSQTVDKSNNSFTESVEANFLCKHDLYAFLTACCAAQSTNANVIWNFPYKLKKRLLLSHFEIVANFDVDALEKVIKEKPALHRFPGLMAKFTKNLLTVLKTFNMENDINTFVARWDYEAKDIRDFLLSIKGFGIKKANMAVLLMKDFLLIPIKNIQNISVAPDIHVCRVLYRIGIIDKIQPKTALTVLKTFTVNEPSQLDYILWYTGKKYCKAKKPKCSECITRNECGTYTGSIESRYDLP